MASSENSQTDLFDCVVVGGGPSGLVAATYLGRFRRRVLLVDANQSRANLIPVTHNCPGFPGGISGEELLRHLRAQARLYGAEFVDGTVTALVRAGDRFVVFPSRIQARTVVIATGVTDILPDSPDIDVLIASGRLRICPVCDAYETIDKSVAVLGPSSKAVKKAAFLRTYTKDIAILATDAIDAEAGVQAVKLEVEMTLADSASIRAVGDQVTIRVSTGEDRLFDAIYPAMGCAVQSQLAADLGAKCDCVGNLVTDGRQRTAVPGLYAAGDVVDELNQLAVGFGHAAIAASDIHDFLG
jgi:thioredoxin reductase (NADPH)